MVPTEKGLDIKGLPITKSTLPKSTTKGLKKILYDKVLNCDTIDQVDVLKALKIMENEIYNSLLSGSKDYYKPVRIKSTSGYDDPMRQFGYKAAYIYNALRLPGHDAIDLDIRNSLDVVKINLNKENAVLIKDNYPELYENMMNLMNSNPMFEDINMIALPLNEPVPEWLLNYIDYHSIITDNLINFPLESIGLFRSGKSTVYTSNILKL